MFEAILGILFCRTALGNSFFGLLFKPCFQMAVLRLFVCSEVLPWVLAEHFLHSSRPGLVSLFFCLRPPSQPRAALFSVRLRYCIQKLAFKWLSCVFLCSEMLPWVLAEYFLSSRPGLASLFWSSTTRPAPRSAIFECAWDQNLPRSWCCDVRPYSQAAACIRFYALRTTPP